MNKTFVTQFLLYQFLEVDLPTSSSLQVYDGEDLMARQVFTLNKTPMHPIYISRSKSVRVVLSTDEHEYTKYRGFQLKYKEGSINVYIFKMFIILIVF